jgi:hypothetical protein
MTDGGTYSNDERGSVVGSQGQLVAQLPGALFSPTEESHRHQRDATDASRDIMHGRNLAIYHIKRNTKNSKKALRVTLIVLFEKIYNNMTKKTPSGHVPLLPGDLFPGRITQK